MKAKKILIATFSLLVLSSTAQTPITLTAANFPPLLDYNVINGMNIQTFPFDASPQTWDFGTVLMPFQTTNYYPAATDPFFSAQCDVYNSSSRTLFGAVYGVDHYWTKNPVYFGENGWQIHQVLSSLTPYTGGANDNVYIPDQNQLFDEARVILKFPVTDGYTNSSDSRRVTNFNLTIAAYGLNNTPGQMVTHVHRSDTVIGYGKMSVYTPAGPSAFYDVLAIKSWQYELDSFYLNGAPAPNAMLTAFGLSQDMIDEADKSNKLYFYRENNSPPFMLVTFGSDPFTTYSGIYVHADNLSMAGNEELKDQNYQVFIYPNPGNGRNITLQFIGKEIDQINYTIRDVQGKIIKEEENHSTSDNKIMLDFGPDVRSGSYFIEISDKDGSRIATEKIQIQ